MPNKNNNSSLGQKLLHKFLLQGVLIGIAMITSVLLASGIIKNVLVKQALVSEAEYFWESRLIDPFFPLPDTKNLSGYLVDAITATNDEAVKSLALGFHELPSDQKFSFAYVTQRNGQKLILGFAAHQVGRLTFYFGLIPLMGVLLVLYLSLWWAYRSSHRAISPVIAFAQQVADLDPAEATPKMFAVPENSRHVDQEVFVLSRALMRFTQRMNGLIDRERNFTRDVSHELRSPLTVIKLAAEVLQSEESLEPAAQKSLRRIHNATEDMEELTNAFLLLARELDSVIGFDLVSLNELVDEEIERVKLLLNDKPIEIKKNYQIDLLVNTSDKALSIVIGNLLRNAVDYTDQGEVQVTIANRAITITDSGIGMRNPEQAFDPHYRDGRRRGGYGVGLSLVKRLSDRFGWTVNITSKIDVGTTVKLVFPVEYSEEPSDLIPLEVE